jgi:hypothetical protein
MLVKRRGNMAFWAGSRASRNRGEAEWGGRGIGERESARYLGTKSVPPVKHDRCPDDCICSYKVLRLPFTHTQG